MPRAFDSSPEASKRRSEAAKRAVATKRKRYRTWPSKKNDHIVCQAMLSLQRGEYLEIFRCQDKGKHLRHHCGDVYWSMANSPAEALKEKKKLMVMTAQKKEAASQDAMKLTLADFEVEAVLIHDEDDPIRNNHWKVTVRDQYADADGTKKEGTKYIDTVMFGWLMAVMLGGDDCDVGAPLYAKLENIFADGTLPRCIP